jgi:hypothetical protein
MTQEYTFRIERRYNHELWPAWLVKLLSYRCMHWTSRLCAHAGIRLLQVNISLALAMRRGLGLRRNL